MLGGLSKGSPLASFQLLKEAGFEGVELISPNELDLNEVLSARDKTGLDHPRSQRLAALAGRALRPRSRGRRPRNGGDSPGIRRLQGLRRHHRPGGPRGRQPERSAIATPTNARRNTSAS